MFKQKQQQNTQKDWHRADIVSALHKNGTSIRKLSIGAGYSSATTLAQALCRRWPKGEKLIAKAIGVHPSTIWPTRYSDNTTNKTLESRQGGASK